MFPKCAPRPRVGGIGGIGVALASALLSTAAAAGDLAVRYEAPGGCGSARAVRERVRRALPEREFASLTATIEVKAEPGGYGMAFHASAGSAVVDKTLHVESCEAAVEAAALLLLLTVEEAPSASDAVGAGASGAPEKPPVATGQTPVATGQTPVAAGQTPTPATPTKADATDPSLRRAPAPLDDLTADVSTASRSSSLEALALELDVGVQGASGLSPGWSPLGRLELAVDVENLRISLAGGWGLERQTAIEGSSGLALRWSEIRAEGNLGWTLRRGPWRLTSLVGLGWLRLSAIPVNTSTPASGATGWLYIPVGLLASRSIGKHVGIFGRLAGEISLERPKYEIGGLVAPAHTPNPLGLALGLGVRLSWGEHD